MLSCVRPRSLRVITSSAARRCHPHSVTQSPPANAALHKRSNAPQDEVDEAEDHLQSPQNQHQPNPAPSRYIVSALEIRGLKHLVTDPPTGKVDLSQVNPIKHDSATWRAQVLRKSQAESNNLDVNSAPTSPSTIAAKQILAQHQNALLFQTFGPQLTQEEGRYIGQRGYDADDIKAWVYILTTEDADLAARAMRTGSSKGSGRRSFMENPIPAFLPLTLLRRPRLSPTALRDILVRLWQELRRHERMPYARFTFDSHAMFLVIVRLVRHARETWPAAMVTVARLFLHYFRLPYEVRQPSHPAHFKRMRRQTFLHNKMLSLLALPTRSTPFNVIPYHQRAQFDVIGAMAGHDPPLNISREGFQSIVGIQLAHRKTPQEQDWSQLKARSWPPWKQDKTGLDADKDQEYGSSRATQAIQRAVQAGYGEGVWERTAKIVAGWDIDRSPTIQTRSHQLHKYVSLQRSLGYGILDRDTEDMNTAHPRFWVARIEATRTVREAWACFLSYQELLLTRPLRSDRLHVYNAMLSKLIAKEVKSEHTDTDDDAKRPLEPGDAQELLPEPISPKEVTWVHTPPPLPDELALEMFTYDIPFQKHVLVHLIARARSLRQGLKYTFWGSRQDAKIAPLLDVNVEDPALLSKVPPLFFTAFIRLLCRFPSDHRSFPVDTGDIEWKNPRTPFFHAVHLMKLRPGFRDTSLEIITRTLESARSRIVGVDDEVYIGALTASSYVKRYLFAQSLVKGLDEGDKHLLPINGFGRLFLRLHERTVLAALEVKDEQVRDPETWTQTFAAGQIDDDFFTKCSINLQKSFYETAEGVDPAATDASDAPLAPPGLPALFNVPTPHILHGMVRVMGFLRDFDGIIKLFYWIRKHQEDIKSTADEPRSGNTILRRAIVAARVCFERSWTLEDADSMDLSPMAASDSSRERLAEILEDMDGFGGWTSDEEVWKYVEKGQGTFPPGNE